MGGSSITLASAIEYSFDTFTVRDLQDLFDCVLFGCDDYVLDSKVSDDLGLFFGRDGANYGCANIQSDLEDVPVNVRSKEILDASNLTRLRLTPTPPAAA